MPFSRQIRSNSTSTGGWLNRPVNTLPLSVRICSGHPIARATPHASPSQTAWVRLPRHQLGADTQNREWSSTPVNALARRPVGEQEPADDVHLPQLHRRPAFPPLPLPVTRRRPDRVDQAQPAPAPGRPPTPTAPGPHPRLASSNTRSAADPNTDASPPQLQHRRLDRGRHLMRTRPRPVRPIRQPLQTLGLIPGQPRMHRLARPPRTWPATSVTVSPSADHRQHGLIPLLGHAQLPHHRECQQSAEVAVNHQPKQCQPSTEGRTSPIRRSNTHGW